jgi:cellulose synthase/poly-beta-1,6-N-acetylglucosamine synthase-like glycosyltransferase
MKGPFSIWAFFGLTLFIDLITLFAFYITGGRIKRINPYSPFRRVSVIIPVHKEKEEDILNTVKAVFDESYPVYDVILCGGSQNARTFIYNAKGLYKNLYYVECPNVSKAKKINFVVQNFPDLLGEFVYVRDCKVRGEHRCIEKMMSRFDNKNVAAVTSYGRLSKPKNYLSRAYFYGKSWINEIGRFRKNAQEKRKAVFVVCGASTIYRTEILKKIPIPTGSKTEDTYYTWILQNKGYRINVADDAIVSAPEVDGEKLEGIRGQVKQSYRWSSGTIQCMYRQGRKLPQNKRLFYTTILPGFAESVMYTIPLVFLPLLLLIDYRYMIGFLIGDAFFSLLGTLIIIPKKFLKTLIHYPEIFFFKYVNGAVFLFALTKVTSQAMTNSTKNWTNEWIPPKTQIK